MTEQEQGKHWLKDQKRRGKFWSTANELSIADKEVHKALNVPESVSEFTGTLGEALACLKMYADRRDNEQVPAPVAALALDQEAEVELYSFCTELPESPAVAWTNFEDPSGFVWSITLRAGLPNPVAMQALSSVREQMQAFGKGAKHYGWRPVGKNGAVRKAPHQPQAPTKPQPPVPPPQPQPGGNGGPAQDPADVKRGSGRLGTLKVDADGRVEFHVDGFKWPFKDGRGAEIVAALFDPALGWKVEHFQAGVKYENVGLTVDWEKPGKYYDVVRVY